MTTYDFTLNRDEVIKGALRLCGVISQGQTPDTSQTNDAAEALNVLVKAWEAEGLPLWCLKTASFTPVASTGSYTVGVGQTVNTQKPLKLLQAWYRNTATNVDVPITLLTQQQYDALPNKSQEGTTSQLYYQPLVDTGVIYTYLVPDSTFASQKTIFFRFQRPFADFDASSDVPDFPQEWIRALKYGLADEISLEYGVPKATRDELRLRAEMFKDEALGFTEEEGSFYFQIDTLRR